MTTAEDVQSCPPLERRGEVRFVSLDERVRLRGAVDAADWLYVNTPAFGPGARGQLDKAIEAAIEDCLCRRGSAASGVVAASDHKTILEDQVYRARVLGPKGILLSLGSLEGLVGSTGALDDVDSATLRFYASEAKKRSVALWLVDTDASLLGYGPPVALSELVGEKPKAKTSRKHAASETQSATTVATTAPADVPIPMATAASPAETLDKAAVHVDLQVPTSPQHWRNLARQLDEAQGPKPLAVVEKLFMDHYVPLSDALSRNEADPRVIKSLSSFRKSFEKSYRDAFTAIQATRKRPPMVFDVPQIAQRVARLHGARTVALVLVAAMRYDLGLRVRAVLSKALGDTAVCAEQMLLWAALPTKSAVQLRLLERGQQGLADPLDDIANTEQEMIAPRGRTSSVMRRVRVGGREIHRLELIQSSLLESGPKEAERLDEIATDVAEPLTRFAKSLQPRTLMFVFGDRGFVLPASDEGTGPGQDGGAAPEQVLVPGQAWLIGSVQ